MLGLIAKEAAKRFKNCKDRYNLLAISEKSRQKQKIFTRSFTGLITTDTDRKIFVVGFHRIEGRIDHSFPFAILSSIVTLLHLIYIRYKLRPRLWKQHIIRYNYYEIF
jgi:hypothetical protein